MVTKGPADSVRCPHGCGTELDFSDSPVEIEVGDAYLCDRCNRKVIIVEVRNTQMITLKSE